MTFQEKLNRRIEACSSRLCVGLDPRPELTKGGLADFLKRVIGESAPHTAAFKPNIAYFEALGVAGIRLLEEEVLPAIPGDIPVILDCKRSDIGETQKYYARAFFETWNVDAVTLNPWMGFDSIEPFLGYEGKGVYLLAVTSNPGSNDLQMREVDGRFLFETVADFAVRAGGFPATAGLVAGLTNLSDEVLSRIPDVPLLVPGFGAQGGDLQRLSGQNRKAPILVNVSRGLLYKNPETSVAEKARSFAASIREILG